MCSTELMSKEQLPPPPFIKIVANEDSNRLRKGFKKNHESSELLTKKVARG